MCDNNFIASESARCLGCAKPSCRNGCPIHNDIPSFIRAVQNGDYSGAVDIVGHPFGEICGYVCPRELHCTAHCVLSAKGAPVQTGELERNVFAIQPYCVQRRGNLLHGKNIAVVGGGVSGITFAVKAYEQGADVTVYERDGLLSTLQLIPNFRLPRVALNRVLDGIQGKFNVIYRNVDGDTLPKLLQQYCAVYLATGQTRIRTLGVSGEQFALPHNKFLTDSGGISGSVAVIGGGNTAIDCARTALKRGCKATVVYRRQRADMPAFDSEINAALGEGAEFCFNVAPVNIVCDGGGLALTVCRTVSDGRGSLTLTDQTYVMHCDTVVAALGGSFDAEIYSQLTLGDDKYHPVGNLYAGGDATGGSLVADAVRDALRAFDNFTHSLGEK